jgi:hypothetical protein
MKKSNGWLPIETAPKDGEVIDLWVTGNNDGRRDGLRWPDCVFDKKANTWTDIGGIPVSEIFQAGDEVTHWRYSPQGPHS